MINVKVEKNNTIFTKIVKGLAISFCITLISIFIFSIILTYTNISESIIPVVITGLTCISIFVGSLVSTKKINKNGMINGGVIGGIYVIALYVISSFLNTGFYVNVYTAFMLVLGIIAGIIGGIIGINL